MGGTACGGSGSGSRLVSMGPGPSGSISTRASRRFAVGLRTHFDGSGAGSGGVGDNEDRSILMPKMGDATTMAAVLLGNRNRPPLNNRPYCYKY